MNKLFLRAPKRPRMTNSEFVEDIMNFSPHGALCQAFILQAITEFAEAVEKAGPEACDTNLVSGHAWHGIAQDILRRYKENYRG